MSEVIVNHKKQSKRKEYNLWLIFICVLWVVFATLLIFTGLQMWFYGPQEHTCQIQKITYPQEIPSNISSSNWESCSCGRICQSWIPCISLYANVIDDPQNELFLVKESVKYKNEKCTFIDHTTCSESRDFNTVLMQVNKTIIPYKNLTTTCYWDGESDYVYLSYTLKYKYMAFIFIAFSLLCITGCFFRTLCKRPIVSKTHPTHSVYDIDIDNV